MRLLSVLWNAETRGRVSSFLRASVLSSALLISFLSALPARSCTRAKLARRDPAEVLQTVENLAASVAPEVITVAALEDAVIAASKQVVAVRSVLLSPFEPTLAAAGMRQRWGLFTSSGRETFRLQVHGRREDGPYRLLYRAHRSDKLDLAEVLAYRRLRGVYNPKTKSGARDRYEAFVTWLAREVFERRPDLHGVRVSMQRVRLGTRHRKPRVIDVELSEERTREGAS